jgi:hypothetical protein
MCRVWSVEEFIRWGSKRKVKWRHLGEQDSSSKRTVGSESSMIQDTTIEQCDGSISIPEGISFVLYPVRDTQTLTI